MYMYLKKKHKLRSQHWSGVQIVGSLNYSILHLRTVTEQSTTNLQMLSWGLITFLLCNLSPHNADEV